jgi:ribosome maturation factor RimP
MMDDQISENLEQAIKQILDDLCFELIEFNLKRRGSTVNIKVLADRFRGGITVEECSSINRAITRYIERQCGSLDDFTVEVSSPGLDRPLRSSKDFMKVTGRDVVFYLNEVIEGKKQHTAQIIKAEQRHVIVKGKNKEISIPLDKINKAVQIL